MTTKVVFTGRTHNTPGRNGGTRSSDGALDLRLPQPHPAAENLFGAAWSACFMAAIQLAASRQKIALPAEPSIDAEIDLNLNGETNYFLSARLNVSVPGLDRETALALVHTAHEICPYSKAVRGNIDVDVNLV